MTDEQHKQIFEEGWSRLKAAKTFEEKQEALNGITYSVESNRNGDCVGISRAIGERLSSRTPVKMADFKHLNHQFQLDPTDGILYARKDVPLELPGEYYHGRPEDDVLSMLFPSQKHPAKRVLHKNFLEAFDINEGGFKKDRSAKELSEALKNAGNGAIAYAFPGAHVFPVVNIKGDILAIENYGLAHSSTEAFTDELCENQQVSYAISKQKVHSLPEATISDETKKPSVKTEEPPVKTEEPLVKVEEPLVKTEGPSSKTEELPSVPPSHPSSHLKVNTPSKTVAEKSANASTSKPPSWFSRLRLRWDALINRIKRWFSGGKTD